MFPHQSFCWIIIILPIKYDVENLLKLIMDVLTRVAYVDDGQVAHFQIFKRWGDEGGTSTIIRVVNMENLKIIKPQISY